MADIPDSLIAAEGQVVIVHLGSEAYGIRIEHIHTVIALHEVTRVPQTPPWIRGLMNLRGQVLPVIDLRTRFELAAGEDGPRTRVVIVNADGVTAGLVVDGVSKVLSLAEAKLEPASGLMNCRARDCITAIGKAPLEAAGPEKLVMILDAGKVLRGSLDAQRAQSAAGWEADDSGRQTRLSA